jgi:hypothetical protein
LPILHTTPVVLLALVVVNPVFVTQVVAVVVVTILEIQDLQKAAVVDQVLLLLDM